MIDTNVLVSAIRSRNGASFALIGSLGDPRWTPAISVALILEYEEVLMREAKRFQLPLGMIEIILDAFCAQSSRHSISFSLRPSLKDPDDEFLLDVAVSSQAEFIVTYNIRDFEGADAYGVRPVTPFEFLKIIGVWQ